MNAIKSFSLGRTVITPAALDANDITAGLLRHQNGDWGNLCKSDKKNDIALKEGFRLLSSYKATNGTTFWIITEADRSVTTILLPTDY